MALTSTQAGFESAFSDAVAYSIGDMLVPIRAIHNVMEIGPEAKTATFFTSTGANGFATITEGAKNTTFSPMYRTEVDITPVIYEWQDIVPTANLQNEGYFRFLVNKASKDAMTTMVSDLCNAYDGLGAVSGTTATVSSLNVAVRDIAASGYIADAAVLHPLSAGQLRSDAIDNKLQSEVGNALFKNGQVYPMLGLNVIQHPGVKSDGVVSYENYVGAKEAIGVAMRYHNLADGSRAPYVSVRVTDEGAMQSKIAVGFWFKSGIVQQAAGKFFQIDI